MYQNKFYLWNLEVHDGLIRGKYDGSKIKTRSRFCNTVLEKPRVANQFIFGISKTLGKVPSRGKIESH